MSSTNKTEHYNLPQFIGSDIPTWLGDINSAMTAIDSGINAAATSASGAATTAAQALTDAEAAQNALNAKANTSTLATVESTSTASQAHAVGDYLVYNGILYRVTAAISSGQTLVPGTNITDTTAGAELASLNNGLTSHYVELDSTDITASSGTIKDGSIVRISYNNHNITINYYIRVANSTGRPTITLNGFPTLPTSFFSVGFPTHARTETTNYITDSNSFQYKAGTAYATLTFYNYIGEFPSGDGYLVVSGSISRNY